MDMLTRLRCCHYIAGVLANQQHDPLCSTCRAFTNSVQQIRQDVQEYMKSSAAELKALSGQDAAMLADITMILADLQPVADAPGQKKAGNCLLPQGVCFVKSSKALGTETA